MHFISSTGSCSPVICSCHREVSGPLVRSSLAQRQQLDSQMHSGEVSTNGWIPQVEYFSAELFDRNLNVKVLLQHLD